MKRKWMLAVPFVIIPLVIPVYTLLDKTIFVDVFGCGCVPMTQTNMFNTPFNANDLRLTVFAILTVLMGIFGFLIMRGVQRNVWKVLYCAAVLLYNGALTIWFVKAFMWA